MDIEVVKNFYLTQSSFIQEQFIFEKSIVDEIVHQCNGVTDDKEYMLCKNYFYGLRRVYKDKLTQYFLDLQKSAYQQMKHDCMNIKDQEKFITCLSNISKSKKQEIAETMIKFKKERRVLIDNLINHKLSFK